MSSQKIFGVSAVCLIILLLSVSFRTQANNNTINLLSNPSFENWSGSEPSNWKFLVSGNSRILKETADILHGNNAIAIQVDDQGNNGLIRYKTQLPPDQPFTLSFYAKAVDNSETVHVGVGTRNDTAQYKLIEAVPISSSWVQYFVTLPQSSEPVYLELNRLLGNGGDYALLIDNLSLISSDIQTQQTTTTCISGNSTPINTLNLHPGDTLSLQRNQIIRGQTLVLENLGSPTAPIKIDACGTGHDPIITNLEDYSVANGYNWVRHSRDIYKLENSINEPLLAPWGNNNRYSHGEFNLLSQGDFEEWSTQNPDGWVISKQGNGQVQQSANNYDGTDSALELQLPNQASKIDLSATVTLEPDTDYVIKVRTKSDGNANVRMSLAQTVGSVTNYLTTDRLHWSTNYYDHLIRTENGRYIDDWIYFRSNPRSSTTNQYTLTFTNELHNNQQQSTTLLDDLVIIERKELNDNFQVALTTNAEWDIKGFDALEPVTRGYHHLGEGLQAGEWSWDGKNFYYHLNPNETINNLHIEIGQGKWARDFRIIPGIFIINSQNFSIKNIDVRYVPKYGVRMLGENQSFELSRIHIQEADMGFVISGESHDGEINYAIVQDVFEHSYYFLGSQNMNIFNNLSSGTKTNNGFTFYPESTGLMQNNIATGNNEVSLRCYSGIIVSHNILENGHDGNCIVDPATNFVNITPNLTPLFTPNSNSVAIDAGTYIGETFDHSRLPIVGQVDIGPIEYQPESEQLPTLLSITTPTFSVFIPIIQ